MFDVHPSAYYPRLRTPNLARKSADKRLAGLIKQLWLESGCIYGYRKLHRDLRDEGENCGVYRLHKLMKAADATAQVGYRKPRHKIGQAPIVAPSTLARKFNPAKPDQAWVTDITYIKTHGGWLYLGVVMGLYPRRIVGWSMGRRILKELVLDAFLLGCMYGFRPRPVTEPCFGKSRVPGN